MNVNQPTQLSLEQEFNLRSFASQVEKMSREQAQEFLVMLHEQMLLKDAMYKQFLKHQWGLESNLELT